MSLGRMALPPCQNNETAHKNVTSTEIKVLIDFFENSE